MNSAISSRWHVIVASLLLYALACATPCLEFQKDGRLWIWNGLDSLGGGWIGLFFSQFAWLANPLWLAGLLLLAWRRWTAAMICALLALLFAANTFLLLHKQLPGDEGGMTRMELQRLLVGFYFWLASFAAAAGGAFVLRAQVANQSPQRYEGDKT
jgi:hypothetical protein